MNRLLLTSFLLLSFAISSAHAQVSPADTLLNNLSGKWLLVGTIAGNHVEHDIIADRVLGQQYFQIKETSREKQANGSPVYDAIVYITFDRSSNQYNCLWLDNTSNAGLSNGIIAHAKKETNKLALLFKFNEHSFFHTTFTYNPADTSWHWLMSNDENGKQEIFADAVMHKTY